jgi:hypothetical protein
LLRWRARIGCMITASSSSDGFVVLGTGGCRRAPRIVSAVGRPDAVMEKT